MRFRQTSDIGHINDWLLENEIRSKNSGNRSSNSHFPITSNTIDDLGTKFEHAHFSFESKSAPRLL